MTDKEIIQYLRSKFGDSIKETEILPKSYKGSKLKAILLGADPTNNGTKELKGLIELKTVFGIDEYNEFFRPQLINLNGIGLNKENLYIQNVCRNYFKEQTSGNKQWSEAAKIWLPLLNEELNGVDPDKKLPVLVTSEVIMKVLINSKVIKAREIYDKCLPFYSDILNREVFALYRHPAYTLSLKSDKNNKYREFLKEKFK